MRRSKFSAEVKEKVLQAIEAGKSVKDISAETDVPTSTISNWKKEQRKRNGEGGRTRKRKSKGESIEQRVTNLEWSLSLEQLVTKALRKMIRDPNKDNWPQVEIDYLRERLALLGHTDVKPLTQLLEESEEQKGSEKTE